ncbi:MAG: peptidase [Acidimicrobiales bacterium]|nr:MAG: peptidase [Acidimicrobiales bacterium]
MAAQSRPVLPYGAWPSPIGPDMAAGGGTRISDLVVSGTTVWWLESRPSEAGRVVAVRRREDGTVADVTPREFSVRTLVHQYGGGAYLVDGEAVVFSNQADQRLWRQEPGRDPAPITPEPDSLRSVRYADGCVTPDRRWIVCVRETHMSSGVAKGVTNQIVAVPSDGRGEQVAIVVSGPDFVAAPRLSPDGRRLAWLSWDHPDMPWDATALWVGTLSVGADGPQVDSAELVAGGAGRQESVLQPTWSLTSGDLYFVSDRTGWWNVWRWGDSAPLVEAPLVGAPLVEAPLVEAPLVEAPAEMARPPWALGLSDLAAMPDGRLGCRWSRAGSDHLGLLDPDAGRLEALAPDLTVLGDVRALGDRVACLAGSATSGTAVVVVDPPVSPGAGRSGGSGVEVVRPADDLGLGPGWAPVPQALEVPTSAGTVHGLYWPPTNPEVAGHADDRPPLLVICHGGPTGATSAAFDVRLAYWTSRGFAVAGVNYRGSTGYGREYRQALNGQWGIADVEDCQAIATYLADAALADRDRMVVRGASAGGLTALCALAAGKVIFAAGVSHYGVLDLETLAGDTHKFESRYLDRLVGTLPEKRAAYVERSPLWRLDQLHAPVLLLQGSEDPIVPSAQAERMAEALREKGAPFVHVVFDGEGHGWRQGQTISRALELELSFYAQTLGLEPADQGEQVQLENWLGRS